VTENTVVIFFTLKMAEKYISDSKIQKSGDDKKDRGL